MRPKEFLSRSTALSSAQVQLPTDGRVTKVRSNDAFSAAIGSPEPATAAGSVAAHAMVGRGAVRKDPQHLGAALDRFGQLLGGCGRLDGCHAGKLADVDDEPGERLLTGGAQTAGLVRVGATVRRPAHGRSSQPAPLRQSQVVGLVDWRLDRASSPALVDVKPHEPK
jgi:hypothetical protein